MSQGKYILGISAHFHDSAAVLLEGSNLLAAAQEERFTRKKADCSFPANSIKYCLSCLPDRAQIDCVAYYENPLLKLDRIFTQCVENSPKGARIWPQTLETADLLSNKLPKQLLSLVDSPEDVFFVPHHLSHAASAFYPSGLKESGILVVDGVGESATTSIYHGQGGSIRCLKEIRYPHSLGLFYSAFTQYCGFKVNSGEYKLMGLAPFGRPLYKNLIFEHLLNHREDGSFTLNMKYFSYATAESTIGPLFDPLFGKKRRDSTEAISQHYRDVAASAQAVLEQVMCGLAKKTLEYTGSNNLCLAGGVALNCVSNSRVVKEVSGINKIWVQPASGDAGGALGAALAVSKTFLPSGESTASPFAGPSFSADAIQAALDKAGLNYTFHADEGEKLEEVCDLLIDQQIVGLYDDRMEFGPRALGNRSIIADPRAKGMLKKVNKKIKFRESWRPFAPAILEEKVEDYFEGYTESPFMLFTSKIKHDLRINVDLGKLQKKGERVMKVMERSYSKFPAISHVDYSSRIQTVSVKNGHFYRLLRMFFRKTGCPMLLNTSFNVRGEPIVCTPKDAVDCFLNTHMDVLSIGAFLVIKKNQDSSLKSRAGKVKYNAD